MMVKMSERLRMYYYLPDQSRVFSKPKIFETDDYAEWEKAIDIAHEKQYEIVRVEHIKE